jgi:two-component system, cell cycle sensor histidine kinase and response regulator CckA
MVEKQVFDESIHESERKYRLLAENVRDVVWTMDLEGRMTYISPSVKSQTGYLPEEFCNRPLSSFLTPESTARVASLMKEQLSRPPDQRDEFAILELKERTSTGDYIDVEANASWLRDANGTPIGFVGVTRDVTARKRTEQKLRDSEERFRALVSFASEGIIVHENGVIVDANQAAADMAGLPDPESLIGIHGVEDIPFTPESRIALRPHISSMSQKNANAEILRPDGTRIRVLVRGRAMTIRGRLRRIVSILDITDRYEAELALRDSEAKFRTIGMSAPDALVLINDEGLVEYWNPAAECMFGYSASEMQGTDVHSKVLPESFRSRFQRAFHRFRESGTGEAVGRVVELTAKRKNGNEFPIEIAVNPIPIQGKYWASAIVRDITDRKRAEEERNNLQEQLAQVSKMEAIGRLAGGIAHDFNNLLTTILGYSEMIQSRLDDGDPIRSEIEEIHKAGERAASLTQQLLAFSRKQVIKPKAIDLNATVKEARKMLERLIGENVQIVFDLAPNLGHIKADPHQIDQVLLNLAINGRDAMPRGGTLTIATANIELNSEDHPHLEISSGSYVALSVADTGIGMNEEIKARMFEPFFSTKERGKGTGLGLPMVYGIAKQNGGAICVNSEPGLGAVFRIYLPRSEDRPETPSSPHRIASPAGSETILLVEDNDMVRRLARRILKRLGYRVLEACNADDAIQIAAKYQAAIHMLLSDVIMPGITGVELYDRLRKTHPAMEVLFMSGYAESLIMRQDVLSTGAGFIQKPFNTEDLAFRVRQVLDKTLTG